MVIRPNTNLKMYLFKNSISQRELSFGTGIDEAQISKAIKYGLSTKEMRDMISEYLKVRKEELFPWDE